MKKLILLPENDLGPCSCIPWHKKGEMIGRSFIARVWFNNKQPPFYLRIELDEMNINYPMIQYWLDGLKEKRKIVIPLQIQSLHDVERYPPKRGRKKEYTKLRFYEVWARKKNGNFLIMGIGYDKKGQQYFMV